MNRAIAAALWGAFALACTACDGTIFKTYDLNQGQSLSVDARQRLVFVGDRYILDPTGNQTKQKTQIICTEPSPDAIVAKAAAIAASATSPQVAAALSSSFTESAASIGVRTPTIQLLRDGLFRACEAYMNNILTRQDYHAILFNYDRIMTALLIVEAAAGFKLPPNVAINAGQVGLSANTNLATPAPAPATTPGGAPAPAPAPAGGSPAPAPAGGSGAANAATTSQPATAAVFGTGTPGYDGSAAAAKDVLLEVAKAMLEDNSRYAFCTTPPASEVDAETATASVPSKRNQYFHMVCRAMADGFAAQVRAAQLRNQMKEKCLANPKLEACKNLTW